MSKGNIRHDDFQFSTCPELMKALESLMEQQPWSFVFLKQFMFSPNFNISDKSWSELDCMALLKEARIYITFNEKTR